MSVSKIGNEGLDVAALLRGSQGTAAPAASDTQGGAASFALTLAAFRSQTLASLVGGESASAIPASSSVADLSALLATQSQLSVADSSKVKGLSPTGRNLALFDPESAYKMMTVINNDEVAYKAQYSELSQMQAEVSQMQQAGEHLGSIAPTSDNASIKAQLQQFTEQYNDWVRRFDTDMQGGGLLAETQAAQVSRYELKQSIENPFNGASHGLRGLGDLGISIDPVTQLASLDTSKLDGVLATNKAGAVAAVQDFSANFAKSAQLLNSAGNFIPDRLGNLDRVIHYIADNKTSLQAEFGLGDPAKPSGQLAQALAAYNQVSAT